MDLVACFVTSAAIRPSLPFFLSFFEAATQGESACTLEIMQHRSVGYIQSFQVWTGHFACVNRRGERRDSSTNVEQ